MSDTYDSDADLTVGSFLPGAPVPGHHSRLVSDRRNGAWTSCCCGWASSIGLFKNAVVALHAHLAAAADPTPCTACAHGRCQHCDGRTCPCAGAGHG